LYPLSRLDTMSSQKKTQGAKKTQEKKPAAGAPAAAAKPAQKKKAKAQGKPAAKPAQSASTKVQGGVAKAAKGAAKPAKAAKSTPKKVQKKKAAATDSKKAPQKATGSGKAVKTTSKAAAAKVKALKATKAIKKGTATKTTRKIRTNVHFFRPHTLRLKRNPKYPKKSVPAINKLDQWRIIKHPLTTESAMKKIEDNNTLVFIVDLLANKHHIKDAINKMYDIKAQKVNTLIRPDGTKKAYVRLTSDFDALDVANKIGII